MLNTGNGLSTPEFYGVLKLDTNFAFLQPYGITAQATALLEVNTTSAIQTVQIALPGFPGDQLFTDSNTADAANLPQSLGGSAPFNSSIAANLLALFQQNGITLDDSATNSKDPAPTVTAESDPANGDTMWIITSVINSVTSRYYVRSIPADPTAGTAAYLAIDTELQTFNIRPESFLLQLSGQLTLTATISGTKQTFFSIRGAIQIQISDSGFQFFALARLELGGSSLAKVALLAVDPALALVSSVDVTALFAIETDPTGAGAIPGVAGYLKISVSLGTGNLGSGVNGLSPNVNFTGSFQLLFNTTLADFSYAIPNQFLPLLDPTDPTTIVVPAGPPQADLFSVTEANATFPDANSLPQKVAAAVALPANWVGFFTSHHITLNSPTVQVYTFDAAGSPYSWQVNDGANVYYITKEFADPNNSGTSNQLEVQQKATSSAIYIQLQIVGNLDLFNEINLIGSFTITAYTNGTVSGVTIAGDVIANVALLGTLSGSISFTAKVDTSGATGTGLWGGASLSLAAGGIIPGVSLTGDVRLLVNASDRPEDIHFEDPPGTPVTVSQFGIGIAIDINGKLTVGSLLTLSGEFDFSLQLDGPNPGLTIAADAMLTVGSFGNLHVVGVLAVNKQGLVIDLTFSITTGNGGFGSGLGLKFTASATLQLNTSSTAQSYLVNGQNLTVQPGFLLSISGSIEFAGLVTANGSATIAITNQQFGITFNVSLSLGGAITLQASGAAVVYTDSNPGLFLELATSIKANIAGVIDIDASGTLLLNTTKAPRSANGFTAGASSFSLMLNGSVSLLEVLKFNASFEILVGGNQNVSFNANGHPVTETLGDGNWYVHFNASLSFFGLATLSASGDFDWQGQFAVSLNGDVLLGTHSFGLEGDFSLGASLYFDNPAFGTGIHFDINGSAEVSARLFGITFGSLGVSFDARIDSNSGGSVEVKVSVSVKIHILFVTIHAHASFSIGTVQLPTPYYLAGEQGNAQAWDPSVDNGTLYLNTGTRSSQRNLGAVDTTVLDKDDPTNRNSESYILDDAGGNAATGETINVTAFGHTQTFTGVKRIVDDASDGANQDNESLIVDAGVQVPVVFLGGPNSNNFVDNGSGYALAYGGGSRLNPDDSNNNDNQNVLEAGTNVAGAVLVGGPAYNYITSQSTSAAELIGGAGNNQITGGPAGEVIYGHAAIGSVGTDAYQSYGSGGWALNLAGVTATDDAYNAANPGEDTIDGGGGDDFIDAGNGDNAVTWSLQPVNMTHTFLAGQGDNYLLVEGTNNANYVSVTNPAQGTIQVADLSSAGTTLGYLNASGFNNLEVDGGAEANHFTINDLGNSGLQNVTINAGQDIVPTGATQTVADPDNPGLNIVVPVVNVYPHSGADQITILGTSGADTFTAVEGDADQNGRMTQVLVTDADSLGATINFAITNSVASQGDTLTINSLDGNDTINAGGMGPATAASAANYPQLINLAEQVGAGTDTIITSPTFNDAIHLGTGNDTVYGGLGQESFVRDPNATGVDTLDETHDVDFGLYNDKLIMGVLLQDGGSQTFQQYENSVYDSEQQLIAQFGMQAPNFPLNDVGDQFAAGSVVEPISNLFSVVNITGGAGNNTIVVNSPTNIAYVGSTQYQVVPFAGSATLDGSTNTAGGVEFTVVNIANNNASRINVASSGGTSGERVLLVNGSEQADNLTLNASGGGGFRVGSIVESVVSNTFITFRGVQRLVLDTLGGNDNILVNDTAAPTFINFGNGNDNAVVGTVPLIPDTGNRTLEYPNGVPVVNTRAMTNGNSDDLFILGGQGNGTFEVDHNSAMLYLHGGAGINLFLLKTFLVLRNNPSNPNQITNLNTVIGGSGSNRYEYLQNAPVDIVGGTGYNTIVVIGTPIGDTFVIGNNYIAGAGRIVNFAGIQSVEVDGAGGDDTFYVLATDPNLTTTIEGGPGDNTIHIGGDAPPLVFYPPAYTYTPPPIVQQQPPKLVTTVAPPQTFTNLNAIISAFAYALDLAGGMTPAQIAQQVLAPFIAAFGSTVPGYQLLGTSIGTVTIRNLYSFFTPFQFAPVIEVNVSSLTITYQTQTLVPQAPIYIQPPTVTVQQPPFAFQATPNFDAYQIQGRVIIDGGQGEQVNGNTVIFHDENGTPGPGFLRLDTFPQLTSIGQVTVTDPQTHASKVVPLWGQDGNVTDTYLTLGGFGLGIPTSGVDAYPGIQLVKGITEPIYDGVELADVQNLELLLPNGSNAVSVQSVPSSLNLTIDPGTGTNTLDLEASGARTTIDAGGGTNTIVVGKPANILNTLNVNGTAEISEQSVAETGSEIGPGLLNDLPLVFVNTQTPARSFNGPSSGQTLTFTPSATAPTIARNAGSWADDGFQPGDRIAVSGTAFDNGIYAIASIDATGKILTLAAGATLSARSNVAGASVIAEVEEQPIVRPVDPANPNGPLEIQSVVLDSTGTIITDQVQEWGSQEYGVQATDANSNKLYYDQAGNTTTDASLTGIPVINQVATGTGSPVYFNASNNEVFASASGTLRPVYVADFANGAPLYLDASGNLTTTVTSMPFMIPVDRTQAEPWTTLADAQVSAPGTTTLTLDDSADGASTIGSLDTTQIPVNQLVNGLPVYDGGAASAGGRVLLRRRAGGRPLHPPAPVLRGRRARAEPADPTARIRPDRRPHPAQGRRPDPALRGRPGRPLRRRHRGLSRRRGRVRRERQARHQLDGPLGRHHAELRERGDHHAGLRRVAARRLRRREQDPGLGHAAGPRRRHLHHHRHRLDRQGPLGGRGLGKHRHAQQRRERERESTADLPGRRDGDPQPDGPGVRPRQQPGGLGRRRHADHAAQLLRPVRHHAEPDHRDRGLLVPPEGRRQGRADRLSGHRDLPTAARRLHGERGQQHDHPGDGPPAGRHHQDRPLDLHARLPRGRRPGLLLRRRAAPGRPAHDRRVGQPPAGFDRQRRALHRRDHRHQRHAILRLQRRRRQHPDVHPQQRARRLHRRDPGRHRPFRRPVPAQRDHAHPAAVLHPGPGFPGGGDLSPVGERPLVGRAGVQADKERRVVAVNLHRRPARLLPRHRARPVRGRRAGVLHQRPAAPGRPARAPGHPQRRDAGDRPLQRPDRPDDQGRVGQQHLHRRADAARRVRDGGHRFHRGDPLHRQRQRPGRHPLDRIGDHRLRGDRA